jgi:branched-chain amino acid aminotransferase
MYYLNDQFIESSYSTTINIADRGLLLGDGVFTTLKAQNGNLQFFSKHIDRLNPQALALFIQLQLDPASIANICKELLKLNNLEQNEAIIRITLTRGSDARGINITQTETQNPTLLITVAPYHNTIINPLRLCITSIIRNEKSVLTQIKSLNYLDSILARNEAVVKGFDDGIMLNTQEMLTECSVANLFLLNSYNEIITPPISSGVLPGIYRQEIIYACSKLKIPLKERAISSNDLNQFVAGFITNCVIGIKEIALINDNLFIPANFSKLIYQLEQQLQKQV